MRARYPALAEAAALAATPQLRNMATIGGNLLQRPRCWYFRNPRVPCWLKGGDDCPRATARTSSTPSSTSARACAVHPSDPATALLALDASVRLRGAPASADLPLAEFFAPPTDDRRTETVIRRRRADRLRAHPAAPSGARSTYLKAMDRKVWAFALVGVAAVVRMDGAASTTPGSSWAASRRSPGGRRQPSASWPGPRFPTESSARAAEAALEGAQPLAHNGYKVPLAKALVRRALQGLTSGAGTKLPSSPQSGFAESGVLRSGLATSCAPAAVA